jgi:hypothetical protein
LLYRVGHGAESFEAYVQRQSLVDLHIGGVFTVNPLRLLPANGAARDPGRFREAASIGRFIELLTLAAGQSDNLLPDQPHHIHALPGNYADTHAWRWSDRHEYLLNARFRSLFLHNGILRMAQLRHRQCVENCRVSEFAGKTLSSDKANWNSL